MPYRVLSRNEHFQNTGPKRILALDGGGIRGIFTLGILKTVEALLRKRHGDDSDFRLCHYFDLIAGTSTGAIIAAALARGMSVGEVIGHYQSLGNDVFKKDWFRQGILRARYDEDALIAHLKRVFGSSTTLGDESLKTGLLVMTKRMDTGSPWPLGNNPKGKYFEAPEEANWISNADYPLWKVVRASTAAPAYFNPEPITIAKEKGKKQVVGSFVDGGVSPHNNPSLQAVLYATLDGYCVQWPTGKDELLLLSVGTGSADPGRGPSRVALAGAIGSLLSLMDDCADLVELLMQSISVSPTAREIDGEVGDAGMRALGGNPLLHYLRYNAGLTGQEVHALCPGLSAKQLDSLTKMDNPKNMDILLELGEKTGSARVVDSHFPARFDLQ